MKKSRGLKVALTAILSVMMMVSLTACGKGSGKGSNDIDLKEVSYAMEEIAKGQIKGSVSSIVQSGDRVYVACTDSVDKTDYPADWVDGMPPEDFDWENGEEPDYVYENTLYLYSLNPDGSDLKELFSEIIEDTWSLEQIVILKDETIGCAFCGYNETTECMDAKIDFYAPDGKKKDGFGLNDFFENPEDVYVQNLVSDDKDNLYLQADNAIICFDTTGKELFRQKVNGYIGYICQDKDGKVVCELNEEDGEKIKVLDPATKSFKDAKVPEGSINRILSGFGSYDYCIQHSQGIDGVDYNGNRKMILNWVGSNIQSDYLNTITALKDGNFMGYYNDYMSDNDEDHSLIRLRKMDASEVENRQVVVYGGLYVDEEIKREAIKFNKSQSQYQIMIREYSGMEDPESKMNADLLAGDVPDIIDMAWMPEEQYISKGLLMDLYPLMENDPDIKKEDFFENVLSVLETNGKLYRIAPTYQLSLMAGRADDIGDKKNLTIDDLEALEKKYPGSRSFEETTSNTSVLQTLCMNNYDSYIDWNTGKCSFDSEEFAKILDYANTYKNEEDINYDEAGEYYQNIRDHKQLFVELWTLSYEDVELYDQLFNSNIAYIGYPSAEEGYGARFTNLVGIYSKTPSKEGAWAFLKRLLSREYVSSSTMEHGMPLRKDCFEDDVKRVTTTKKYTDDFGVEREPYDYSYGFGDSLEIQIKPLNEKQIQQVRDLVSKVNHRFSSDDQIMEIITEEAGALFSGQKSSKEVAGIIQNRVSTYVNENR